MTHRHALTVLSVLSIFLVVLDVSEDIVRGYEPGGLKHIQTILTLGLWLYATVAIAEGRLKYTLMLLGNLLGVVVSLAHMRGAGLVGGRIADSDGKLLWVLAVLTLGVAASVAAALSARGLWTTRSAARPS